MNPQPRRWPGGGSHSDFGCRSPSTAAHSAVPGACHMRPDAHSPAPACDAPASSRGAKHRAPNGERSQEASRQRRADNPAQGRTGNDKAGEEVLTSPKASTAAVARNLKVSRTYKRPRRTHRRRASRG
jgi:hypothetical protein